MRAEEGKKGVNAVKNGKKDRFCACLFTTHRESEEGSPGVQVRDQVGYLVIRQLPRKRRHFLVRASELPEDILRGGRHVLPREGFSP